MLFSGCAFFKAATTALALSSPYALTRLACHCSSVGLDAIWLPSSLTEPSSMGTFFETSGATSKNDRTLITFPSTHGDQPTRAGPVANGPNAPRIGGLISATAALPAA